MFYRSKVRWFEEVRWVLSIMSLVVDRFGGESLMMLFKGRTMAKPIEGSDSYDAEKELNHISMSHQSDFEAY